MLDNAYFALHPEVMEQINAGIEKAKAESLENESSELPESAPSAKVLTLEVLKKLVIDITLEVSASKNPDIAERRIELIAALNHLESVCK
jgi:hypothetical protein